MRALTLVRGLTEVTYTILGRTASGLVTDSLILLGLSLPTCTLGELSHYSLLWLHHLMTC